MANKIILIRFYAFISALITSDICLYIFNKMSFAGYWRDRFIFWIWLFTTPFVIIIFWKKIWTKLYFCLLVAGLILSILPMALPLFTIILSGTDSGRLNHFCLENNIRIQTVAYGIISRPRLQIVEDGLLFDKILLETAGEIEKNDSISLELRDAKNAKFISETDTSIRVKYLFEKDTVETVHKYKKE